MAITNELYETMCAYFDGELSLEEEKKFLELVASDPELKKEFEWEEKMLFNAVPEYVEMPLVASDAGVRHFGPSEEPGKLRPLAPVKPLTRRRRWVAVASVAAIIIVAAVVWKIYYDEKPSGNKVVDWGMKRIKPHPIIIDTNKIIPPPPFKDPQQDNLASIKERNKQVNKLGRYEPNLQEESPQLGQVQDAFVSEDFTKAIEYADGDFTVRGNEPEEVQIKTYALFYKGIAHIGLNRDSLAVAILKQVLARPQLSAALAQEVRWNMAKAYYKLGNKLEALQLLEPLRQAAGFKHKTACNKLLAMIKASKG